MDTLNPSYRIQFSSQLSGSLPHYHGEHTLLTVESEVDRNFQSTSLLSFYFYNTPWKKIFKVTALAALTAL